MKTPRLLTLLTLLTATLLCVASPLSMPAADVALDISSFAPRNASVILRQIELNVAIRQYEKVLMELHEASLQAELGPTETGLTDEQQKEWLARMNRKQKYLTSRSDELLKQIHNCVADASAEAQIIEKTKAEQSQSKAEPQS